MEKRVEGMVCKRNSSNPPVRNLSPAVSTRPLPRDVRGRNSRDGSARMPPTLPKTMPLLATMNVNMRSFPPYGLGEALADEPVEHHDLGMSPLVRVAPRPEQVLNKAPLLQLRRTL